MKPSITSALSKTAPVLAVFLLGACVRLGSGEAPEMLLTLSAAQMAQPGAQQQGNAAEAMVVLLPEVPRKLDSNRIPVQVDDSSIAYLKDATWADKPARLMQSLLVETLVAKNNRLVLSEIDSGGRADEYLSGSLVEFGVDARTSEVVVIYDAVKYIRGQQVEKRRFETRTEIFDIEAAPVGEALNQAANRIAAEVAEWAG